MEEASFSFTSSSADIFVWLPRTHRGPRPVSGRVRTLACDPRCRLPPNAFAYVPPVSSRHPLLSGHARPFPAVEPLIWR